MPSLGSIRIHDILVRPYRSSFPLVGSGFPVEKEALDFDEPAPLEPLKSLLSFSFELSIAGNSASNLGSKASGWFPFTELTYGSFHGYSHPSAVS